MRLIVSLANAGSVNFALRRFEIDACLRGNQDAARK